MLHTKGANCGQSKSTETLRAGHLKCTVGKVTGAGSERGGKKMRQAGVRHACVGIRILFWE